MSPAANLPAHYQHPDRGGWQGQAHELGQEFPCLPTLPTYFSRALRELLIVQIGAVIGVRGNRLVGSAGLAASRNPARDQGLSPANTGNWLAPRQGTVIPGAWVGIGTGSPLPPIPACFQTRTCTAQPFSARSAFERQIAIAHRTTGKMLDPRSLTLRGDPRLGLFSARSGLAHASAPQCLISCRIRDRRSSQIQGHSREPGFLRDRDSKTNPALVKVNQHCARTVTTAEMAVFLPDPRSRLRSTDFESAAIEPKTGRFRALATNTDGHGCQAS
jgi:hypothetical protein